MDNNPFSASLQSLRDVKKDLLLLLQGDITEDELSRILNIADLQRVWHSQKDSEAYAPYFTLSSDIENAIQSVSAVITLLSAPEGMVPDELRETYFGDARKAIDAVMERIEDNRELFNSEIVPDIRLSLAAILEAKSALQQGDVRAQEETQAYKAKVEQEGFKAFDLQILETALADLEQSLQV